MINYKIGICGLGFVGNAIHKTLIEFKNIELFIYDLYKQIGSIDDLLLTDILYLCLPTPYDCKENEFSKKEIISTLEILSNNNYKGIVLIKSTIEPDTTKSFAETYKNLCIIHNPEFLSARTAIEDFSNQKHIIIGSSYNCSIDKIDYIVNFYKTYFHSHISVCDSTTSESVKLFCNSFYAVKVQYFTELYETCKKLNINYNETKELMLKNDWINPMHTNIPGPDGNISYGGMCFPKDTNALNSFMKKNNIPNKVLDAVINERNEMRKD
jgi:nucleotide sugar dehydrogenase